MKALIALLVVLVLAIVGGGGFLLYKTMEAEQLATMVQEEDNTKNEKNTKKNRGVLTRMKLPKNAGETFERLDYAITKSTDAVGWIEIPDTKINNVVMQSGDNRYYLRRNEDGNEDVYGCYFMDYECLFGSRDAFRPNTVVYGHSDLKDNPDGPRFSELFKFTDPEFAKKHPYVYLYSMEERYVFEIFSVFYSNSSFNHIKVHMTEEETQQMIDEAKKRSIYQYPAKPTGADKLLTLSTCSVKNGTDGDQWYVIMGRLLPADAKTEDTVAIQ